MSDICPVCGVKLTMANTGIGGKLKTGEKLCLTCYKKASRANNDFGLHSGRFTLDEVKSFVDQSTNNVTKMDQSDENIEASTKKSKSNKSSGWIGLIVIAVLIFIGVKMCGGEPSIETKAERAYTVSQEFVKTQLKSPTSAIFDSEYKYTTKDNVWQIEGTVDSDNSFGAKLRANFVVQMIYNGEGSRLDKNNYTLITVTVK